MLRVRALAAATACLLFASCDFAGAPERFYDEEARPPTVALLALSDLKPGQHIAGPITLTLNLDSLRGRVQTVAFYLNDELLDERYSPPYSLDLDTPRWPDGEYLLSAMVAVRGAKVGLPGAAGIPSHVFQVPLVFDQRPPTPVQVTAATRERGGGDVSWTPSSDPNFRAYLVLRGTPPSPQRAEYHPAGGYIISTITDRYTTTFFDSSFPVEYGAMESYAVLVWNGVEYSSIHDSWSQATYGPSFPFTVYGAFAAVHPTRPEVYAFQGTSLIGLSTQTQQQIAITSGHSIARWVGWGGRPLIAPEGDHVYAPAVISASDGSHTPYLLAFEAGSLNPAGAVALPTAPYGSYALGPQRRLYFAHYDYYAPGTPGEVIVLDADTGAELGRLDGFSGTTTIQGLSPDGRTLYVSESPHTAEFVLHALDVSGTTPRRAMSRTQNERYEVSTGTDGRVYLALRDHVIVLEGKSLTFVRTLLVEGPTYDSIIQAFHAGPRGVFVALSNPWGNAGSAVIYRYALGDMSLVETWRFRHSFESLLSTPDVLYVVSNEMGRWNGWAFPLQH